MEIIRSPTEGKGVSQHVERIYRFPNEVNRRRGEPAHGGVGVNQAVDPGEQVFINVVLPSGGGIGGLDEVFYRPICNYAVEGPIPFTWDRAMVV